MNSKTTITLSAIAIVVAVVLFASGPLVATHQAMAFPFHRGFGFHNGFGFHRGFGLHNGFAWNGWGCG
ncbi:MAG: hypothetical protein WBZ36_09830 [Candidatus Nitrosopolaris sp.]